MLPALFCAAALAVALFVQSLNSPLAGAWLPLLLAGACLMLRDGYPRGSLSSYCAAAWLAALTLSTFLLAPISNGGAVFWLLAAMPILALCVHEKHLPHLAGCFATVIAVYSAGLIYQALAGVVTRPYNYPGKAWPVIDPNNAALIVNFGLIPAFWLTLTDRKYLPLLLLFMGGLLATRSIAGGLAALLACGTLAAARYGPQLGGVLLAAASWAFVVLASLKPEAVVYMKYSLSKRFPIWEGAWELLWVRPWAGLGLGSFGFYYEKVRTESESAGWYAHNDPLQFAVEMGIPLAACFALLCLAVLATTNRRNAVSACCLGAALLQSAVEFQFYLPAVSVLAGLALAHHRTHQPRTGRFMPRRTE